MKPATGYGGRGITGEVRSGDDLRRAILFAARFDHRFLVERQLVGTVIRLLVLDGRVIDAVRRLPPHVLGDGRSSIGALMLAESRRRLSAGGWAGLKPLVADLDCLLTLRAARLGLGSVLEPGVKTAVKTVTNRNNSDENDTVLGTVDVELEALAVRAAEALDLRLAGVDVVAAAAEPGVVLEVNSIPGPHHHYLVADPDNATRVAIPILQAIFDGPSQAEAAAHVRTHPARKPSGGG